MLTATGNERCGGNNTLPGLQLSRLVDLLKGPRQVGWAAKVVWVRVSHGRGRDDVSCTSGRSRLAAPLRDRQRLSGPSSR